MTKQHEMTYEQFTHTHTHVYRANIHMSCAEMEKNNSGVRAGEDNNDTVEYSDESDRNLTALRKEPISVAQLGLVRMMYGGVSTEMRSV